MLSRFDICMARLETDSAKAPSQKISDQNCAGGDQPDAESIDTAQPLAKKTHVKRRDKKAA